MTRAPIQLNRADWRRLTPAAKWRRAKALVETSGLLPVVEANIEHSIGRPCQFTAWHLMMTLGLHGIECAVTKQEMHLTRAVETLADAHPSHRVELGVATDPTYRQLWHAYNKLVNTLKTDGLEVPGENRRMDVHEFSSRVIDASIPPTYTLTSCLSYDGTDLETWACTRYDGKRRYTLDPDACTGHRSATNNRPADYYDGSEVHFATQVPTRPRNPAATADPVPHLVVGMHLLPASHHRGHAAVALTDAISARGRTISEIIADRGYTQLDPENFVWPMWERGIDVIADLNDWGRGYKPGKAGTFWLDGTLFSEALPPNLRDLPAVTRNMNATKKRKVRQRRDKRKPYRFQRLTSRDERGNQRFKGPALAGTLRCPNHPPSMRLDPNKVPTSTRCQPGKPCACGITVTVTRDECPRERQRHIWGGSDFARDYGRRNGIESVNGEVKSHRLCLERGFVRVMGTVKTNVLLAFAIAGYNIVKLRDWHAMRYLTDPWTTHLGETDETPARPEPPKGKKTRPGRRQKTLSEAIAGTPPG